MRYGLILQGYDQSDCNMPRSHIIMCLTAYSKKVTDACSVEELAMKMKEKKLFSAFKLSCHKTLYLVSLPLFTHLT